MRIQTAVVVRDKGQVTIPEKIRKSIDWITPSSVVTVTAEKPNEIIIQPYEQKKVDWDKLWKDLKRVRSYRGKGRGNLSAFIAEDRLTRR
ncbi:hypothetical protein A3A49_00890 [Candidatus Curtissbacteria bacterium RIFCSPLOWO2_01_FULL_38_11b]|uniref:SpoVT-AbrB domain-containing protein n=1 Tax=Candidatus Curtissbacteria bacterium RIFCSPLOWO2_01_FULL_38_11b TaxID=1797725 RepID=A0A1F5GYW6_9BACT|nr:MAG: hypothetical protein A3A49_00890 [Candidatus Curtissbacteria bacterium RIFCSPLOWO2_01_FULL_38_11b]